MRLITIAVLTLGALSIAQADTLNLKNGQVIQGTYLGGTSRQIRIEVDGNVQVFEVADVQSVHFSDAVATPPQAGRMMEAPPPPPRPAARAMGVTIPADTMITVRMIDGVDSETSRLGQTFKASLDEPLVIGGQTIASRGADVLTKLVTDEKSGKLAGKTVLTLALVSIDFGNGRVVEVTSNDVQTESSSRAGRSGKVVGGTAALGAIIGGIAGGGKGAAIGAGSGAAVGVGAQEMTSGQRVKIPSETRLNFRLQTPVQL